jgi:hypothetical protein
MDRHHYVSTNTGVHPHTHTTEDILTGVNKLEKVIELDTLLPFQIQISAAIGFSLDFFNRYQSYLLTQRRTRSHTAPAAPVTVNIIPMQCDRDTITAIDTSEEVMTFQPSNPESIIARVCQSLQQMHHLINGKCSNFLAFSAIITDIIGSISHIVALTTALVVPSRLITKPTTQLHVATVVAKTHIQQVTLLPQKNTQFLPPTDVLERLMNTFGHFKSATTTFSRNIDHNIVILSGESGYGKFTLYPLSV